MSAGWLPDPVGRHEERWHDGMGWTDQVRDRGVVNTDASGMAAPAATTPFASAPPAATSYAAAYPTTEHTVVAPPAPPAQPPSYTGAVPAYSVGPTAAVPGPAHHYTGIPGWLAASLVISGFYAMAGLYYGAIMLFGGAMLGSAEQELGTGTSGGGTVMMLGVIVIAWSAALGWSLIAAGQGINAGRITAVILLCVQAALWTLIFLVALGGAADIDAGVGAVLFGGIVAMGPLIVAIVGLLNPSTTQLINLRR